MAKWNHALAQRLGVPCRSLVSGRGACYPLISVKVAEFQSWPWLLSLPAVYDLFLHDALMTEELSQAMRGAVRVFAANLEIATAVRPMRQDVIEAWCPGTIAGNPSRPGLTIWSFGMAHKQQLPCFERLKAVCEDQDEPLDYTLCVSVGIHEDQPWSESFQESERRLRELFGNRLRFLGFLADDALARELREDHAAALFYEPALRANHTTAWSALSAGAILVTNLDGASPPELQHGVNVLDIHQLEQWPQADERHLLRAGARQVSERYGWAPLLALVQ